MRRGKGCRWGREVVCKFNRKKGKGERGMRNGEEVLKILGGERNEGEYK